MHIFWAPRTGADGSGDVRALLGRAVRELFSAETPRIEKDTRGKPFFPERPDIFFSLSHTGSCVLCAVGSDPVGADVETVRPVSRSVILKTCTPGELAEFDFFELWTLKESFFKLFGQSDRPFYEHRFSRSGTAVIPPDPRVTARLVAGVPGCRAAVCTLGTLPDVLCAERL